MYILVTSVTGFSITEKKFDVSNLDKTDVANLEKTTVGSLGLTASKVLGDQRLIDKVSVFRKLLGVFQTGDADIDNNLKMILRNNVINYPFYFGTPCDLYDLDINHVEYQIGTDAEGYDNTGKETWMLFYDKDNSEGGGRLSVSSDFHCQNENHLEVPFNPTSNVVRSGLVLKTCGDILFPEWSSAEEKQSLESLTSNNYLTSVLQKVCGSESCSWDEDNIKKSIHLFYPFLKKYVPVSVSLKKIPSAKSFSGKKLEKAGDERMSSEFKSGIVSSAIPDAVIDVLKKEFNTYTDDDDKFRFLIYTMCVDPNWH